MSQSGHNRKVLLLLVSALLLRAGIPDGYMPAAPGSGLLFELCPSGVPAGFMQALSGGDRHQHHDMPGAAEAHFDASQCPIGHLLSGTVAPDDVLQFDAIPELPVFIENALLTRIFRVPANHRSRGPPA